ncbi:hypothetical protein [Streptomyces sp. NPDC058412]|uniref:hypothetical protein n=1 Tax=Streptomyces sp. NPDC058412 TaxID=3346486 RepID=UPI003649970E
MRGGAVHDLWHAWAGEYLRGAARLQLVSTPPPARLTYWLAAIAPNRLKPATLSSYDGLSRLYIRPALGTKRLNRLSPTDVRSFLADCKGGVSAACAGPMPRAPRRTEPAARWVGAVHAGRRLAPSSTYTPCSARRSSRQSVKNSWRATSPGAWRHPP